MKTFTFPLDRVREWREKQLALEEAQLERLFGEKSLIEESRALLEREARESASIVQRNTALDAFELQAIDGFHRHVTAERIAIGAKLADCGRRIAEQQSKLMEARRKFELLAKLKRRKWTEWNAELARELEIQAGELFLAKWSRR